MPEKGTNLRLLTYRKQNTMNTLIKVFGIFVASSILIGACRIQALQGEQKERSAPKVTSYQTILGHSLHESVASDFIARNNCSRTAQFQLCEEVGVALLIGADQTVETVYLYLNNVEGFAPYQGELPFGLKFYDTMGAVEYKLKRQRIGSAGLPDTGETPDHLHYWATYQQVSMTIIYNSPSAEDEDATIYSILVSQ
jgi:hypothetical protein